jgi:murein DD-endopeptidase MepM/ murein hydrolase activator NlpD
MYFLSNIHLILIGLVIGLAASVTLTLASPLHHNPAQTGTSFVYTVQPDDTLVGIAVQYQLKLPDLLLTNDLIAAPFVFPGDQLVLPGVPPPAPTSPPSPTMPPIQNLTPVPIGSSTPLLRLPLSEQPHVVKPGETLYSIASQYGVPAGTLALVNDLADLNLIEVGQVLQIPVGPLPTPGAPVPPFVSVELSEPVIAQGRTLVVKVTLSEPAGLTGSFEGQPLFFNQTNSGELWAITAIHVLLEPNTYPILLTATKPDGTSVTRIELVEVAYGPYGEENIILDDDRSALLDPELLAQERAKLLSQWTRLTPRPMWQGVFGYPVAGGSDSITSNFGTRRTYNNSTELSFHAGTDFAGEGIPIFAPAGGTVVIAEPLTVRGNAVLINHGMGLYSGMWHQSQLVVADGQKVQAGDLIGYTGGTGLVTGPHLHWEVRLNGIAVDPLQWTSQPIP